MPSKIYFLPANATRARARAKALGYPLSIYLATLLRNAIYRGEPRVEALSLPEPGREVRRAIPLSLPAKLHADAATFARYIGEGTTISRLLEHLVECDQPDQPLVVWPVRP